MDKQPPIPIKNKPDLSPHAGVFQAASEGELGFTSWGGTDHSWHSASYRPMKNAMCKRWDTPRKTEAPPVGLRQRWVVPARYARAVLPMGQGTPPPRPQTGNTAAALRH